MIYHFCWMQCNNLVDLKMAKMVLNKMCLIFIWSDVVFSQSTDWCWQTLRRSSPSVREEYTFKRCHNWGVTNYKLETRNYILITLAAAICVIHSYIRQDIDNEIRIPYYSHLFTGLTSSRNEVQNLFLFCFLLNTFILFDIY